MSTNVITLPSINTSENSFINQITSSLGVPRNIVAPNDEISFAWSQLGREINRIAPELRNELLARMCIAISVGLFDGAINYVWNASIDNLRNNIKNFGFSVVAQIKGSNFDEQTLFNLKDSELLDLCLKLNLLSEEGFYYLNQCRDMRNNFSAAHPSMGFIDDRELINYISRCSKYALSKSTNSKGVNITSLTSALKSTSFSDIQFEAWIDNLKNTHEAQREIIFSMLYGIYCDPTSSEIARLNALRICDTFSSDFTSNTILDITNKHYDYQAKGDEKRYKASLNFFERLLLLSKLNNSEQQRIFTKACKNLEAIHLSNNNFYNEPPFAERLLELSSYNEVPENIKELFVYTVVLAYVGNPYGYCHAAENLYEQMIKSFTSKEILILLELPEKKSILTSRINSYIHCKKRFLDAINLINPESIPSSLKNKYEQIKKS